MPKEKAINKDWTKQYFEKLVKQSEIKDRDKELAANMFGQRITSMMRDYDISMSTALLWDFEGFENDVKTCIRHGTLEEDFMYYLWQNNVYGGKVGDIYLDVFMGRKEDFILKKIT